MSTTHENYVRQLLAHFDADPDRAAVVSGGVTLTTGELAEATRRAGAVMRGQGVGRGDVVGILTEPNTPATLILRWAANLLGATAAHVRGMNAVSPDDELRLELQRAIVAEVGARVLAVDAANAGRARELLAAGTGGPVLAVYGPAGPDTVDLTAESGSGSVEDLDSSAFADEDLAVITQTSGSTGHPKGVCWPFAVKNEMATSARTRSADAHLLITAPLTHSSGFGADDTLFTGGVVILHPGFDPGAVLRAVAEHGVTRLILGTPQVYALATHPDRPGTDLSSLSELIYTGSHAAPLRLREALEIFGPVLMQVYGTTETGVLTMLFPGDHHDLRLCGTVGRPLNPDAVSVRDPDTGVALPAGEVGEVCAVPRWAMAGYWHEPELTAQATRDGWTRTGDLGHLDDDGYLHLTGRLSDVMKVKGILIHPAAVERVLSEAPGVSQAAVCGVEDADRVERIYAAVVARPGTVVDLDDLRRHVSGALSDNHVPSVIEICQELPVIGPGKPDRARLRTQARAAFGRDVSRV
ncbi:fatty acid CoA ligase [Longispora fulva]|uniref:Fatty-acyl-CoA synthase n=1 Tax=Longispora fulva TaxID=619741 RepID=A0A8J7KPP7_9ACTN|nr:long-chain fatty acid--CoA ligase [Longispora fulva]MBG6141546.1 fatty-acyl-CoA synthase [Longispora fulva]GIG59302.1 fatty acid CoA ligase [Longispora fulva]